MHEVSSNGHPEPLTNGDFTGAENPFQLFDTWFAEAAASEARDPNAMALATVDSDLMPNVRIVLLKGVDPDGFVFFTNSESRKGGELGANRRVALVFHWKSLNRQVRVRGTAAQVSAAESDAYFATRPRDSRIGAWASQQSRPLESRTVFEEAVAATQQRFAGQEVPRPPYWNGYRVVPISIEFWHDRPFRMHDRIVFTRTGPDQAWSKKRLYP